MADERGSRLGRGLAALIGDTDNDARAIERARTQRRIPIEFIQPNARNPRRNFEAEALDDLVRSIAEKGIVQPILVRPLAEGGNRFEIIAGERRWRAAQKAGLHEVPVFVHDADDRESLELAIIENVQRADLNALEEATGYDQLMNEFSYTQQQLADRIGKSRSHIANTLRLLRLPESVKAFVADGRLSAGHARAVAAMDDPEAAARRIIEGGMSVREAEKLSSATRSGGKPAAPRQTKDADTRALEESLANALGLKVDLRHSGDGGELRLRYRTLEQLDELVRLLTAR
ncbi:MAG: ParB/RepB/Spo0J family partition protein [Flavobacteriaceae bacterium]